MIRHLLKMVWNRKRTNLLIVLEIFVSFLVLFTVVSFGTFCFNNYKLPLGFSVRDTWMILIDPKTYMYGVYVLPEPSLQEKYRHVYATVQNFEQVQAIAAASNPPYSSMYWGRYYSRGARQFFYRAYEASDSFKDLMGLQVVRGRWFQPDDDASKVEPVVVNEEFARKAFGDGDSLGMIVTGRPKLRPGGTTADPYQNSDARIVGIIRGFRMEGEYSASQPYVIHRRPLRKSEPDMLRGIMIRIKPGTPRSFEEQLTKALNAVAGDWAFQVIALEDSRKASLRQTETMVIIAAIIAGSLMLMVAFGLLGVLWQSVTQRTTEIGLRRAQGATAADIYKQILGELFFIATMAMIPGVLLVIQFPLLDLIGSLKIDTYFISIALSMVLIYGLIFVCGLYPGWLATRIRPAKALHCE